MENYPEIQRRNGTLFFACPEFDKGAISTTIERLIDLMDALDDDPDLEPSLAGTGWGGGDDREGEDADFEPSIGWPTSSDLRSLDLSMQHGKDLEEDGADYEPSLAALERHPHPWGDHRTGSQEWWADSSLSEREDDGDDLEPDEDGEGLLGNPEHIDQSAGGNGLGYEGEEADLGWTLAGDCGDLAAANDGREHDDSDRELNGDETDWSCADDISRLNDTGDGSGIIIARDLIRGLPIAAKRAAAYMALGPN